MKFEFTNIQVALKKDGHFKAMKPLRLDLEVNVGILPGQLIHRFGGE